jgi:hypothetical protein
MKDYFENMTSMSDKAVKKMAEKDAERWAAAEMFYGEGAGTRRKLLNAEILTKSQDTLYAKTLHEAYEKLDMNKFAEMAIKERKALDRAAKASQNMRALKNGNYQNLTTGVAVVVGLGYAAHVTGYDKVIIAEAKKAKAWVVMKYKMKKATLTVVPDPKEEK